MSSTRLAARFLAVAALATFAEGNGPPASIAAPEDLRAIDEILNRHRTDRVISTWRPCIDWGDVREEEDAGSVLARLHGAISIEDEEALAKALHGLLLVQEAESISLTQRASDNASEAQQRMSEAMRVLLAVSTASTGRVLTELIGCSLFQAVAIPDEFRGQLLLKLKPRSVSLFWLGLSEAWRDRDAEAIRLFGAAIASEPSYAPPRLFLARTLGRQGQHAEALKTLARIPPGFEPQRVGFAMGNSLLALGRAREAAEAFELAANPPRRASAVFGGDRVLDETSVGYASLDEVMCRLGEARLQLGDPEGAKQAFGERSKCGLQLARVLAGQGWCFDAIIAYARSSGEAQTIEDGIRQIRCFQQLGAQASALERATFWDDLCARYPSANGCPGKVSELRTLRRNLAGGAKSSEDESLLARLRAPRRVPWTEHALPDQEPSSRLSMTSTPTEALLASHEAVARWTDGHHTVIVSRSRDLDPRGEVSHGGYWVWLFEAGTDTIGPCYLGFADQYPYVVSSAQPLPLLDGNVVQIAVESRPVDPRSITLPPIGLRAKEVRAGLFLRLPLEAITRDTDHDGLTDLYEEKIGTDPNQADTDGDGQPDRLDSMPLSARVTSAISANRGEELLMTVLEALKVTAWAPTVHRASPCPGRDSRCLSATRLAESFGNRSATHLGSDRQVVFLQGDELTFRGMDPLVRTLVFSKQAAELYDAKFGATFMVKVTAMVFDESNDRAFVEYTAGWYGGSFLATHDARGWTLQSITSWVT
ncbi:MAG: hypothetical protein HYV07_11165 [Deltaproteobacteria bacterium]|nr:hypothetical protein [Deltaproteobacteria bacterium]